MLYHGIYNSFLLELAKRFEQMPPETVAHRMGDRVAHRNGNIRSQLDEMQRINIEKMRELNR